MFNGFFFNPDSLFSDPLLFNDFISSTIISFIQLFWPFIWSKDLEKGILNPKILASIKLSWMSLWVALYPFKISYFACLISYFSASNLFWISCRFTINSSSVTISLKRATFNLSTSIFYFFSNAFSLIYTISSIG